MKEIIRYPGCFVCGDKNTKGLQAKFYFDGTRAVTETTADKSFEGYKSILHGGILAAMLDEVMIKAILATDVFAVTAEMTVRYCEPVHTGDNIKFAGWVLRQKGRVFYAEGEAVRADGTKVASSRGTYIQAKGELKSALYESIE